MSMTCGPSGSSTKRSIFPVVRLDRFDGVHHAKAREQRRDVRGDPAHFFGKGVGPSAGKADLEEREVSGGDLDQAQLLQGGDAVV